MRAKVLETTSESVGTAAYRAYRPLLPPETVRDLSVLRPARAVRDVALAWTAIVAAWALVAWHPAWWTVLLAIPVIGTRYYAIFIVGHDGLHRRIFRDRAANDRFNDLLILGPIGGITRVNNRNHLQHHLHLATPDDPDRHRHGCFNKSDRPDLTGFLSGVASVGTSLHNVFLSSPREPAADDDRAPRHTTRDIAILLGWQAALIGGLTWAIGWWAYLALWAAPVFIFTVLMDNFRSFAEHSHPEADELADEHRLLTYEVPLAERVLFAPNNMNLHAVHHLWPSIPYYNLPSAQALLRQVPEAASIEIRTSYLAYLRRYWQSLPLPGCRRPTPAAA